MIFTLFTYINNIMSSILILMPGIDYHINHGKPFIIITFVIKCAIPSILLYGKAFAASDPTKQIGPYLRKVFQQILWEHTNVLTESAPISLVGITFLQGLLLKIPTTLVGLAYNSKSFL